MAVWVRRGLIAAAGFNLVWSAPAFTQTAAPPAPATAASPLPTSDVPLDPEAPLADLPDLGVAWPDLSAAPADPAAATQQTDVAQELRYGYTVEGIDEVATPLMKQRFNDLSVLKANEKKPANAAQLDRRAREDAELLQTLLRGEGYYDAEVTTGVLNDNNRVTVTLSAVPGTLYKFADVDLAGVDAAGTKGDALRGAFGVKQGDPVNADTIATGEAKLRTQVGREGFAFGKVGEPAIVVDRAAKTATMDVAVAPGSARTFGKIVMPPRPEGQRRIFGPRHVQDIARFKPGQPYDSSELDDLRRALIQTGLVSAATVKPVEPTGPDVTPAAVDIEVAMEPAPPRTIAGELGYGTGEGARVEASWTHRNLFPPEGALTIRSVLGTREQLANLIYRRNNFHGRDRILTVQALAANLKRDAYQAKTLGVSGAFERQTNIFFQKKWTWSIGGELLASDERDVERITGLPRRRTFFIGAVPLALNYDGSDDLLNPTRGFRLGGRISPELSLQGTAFGYARVQLDASAYQPMGSYTVPLTGEVTPRVVFAQRVRLGTIAGAPRDAIAPSRRFYAGGGGSVRGYGFQRIGPRDVNDDPIGGRSLAEFSLEARVKVWGNLGIVPFVDAGSISTTPLPTLSGVRVGAGLGFRYYSSFGPIRIDVGTPINPRTGDSRLGVYVSLGQAFLKVWLRRIFGTLALLIGLVALVAVVLDSQLGHRLVTDAIRDLKPKNGLRYSVGRIEGSLYNNARLVDVRVSDAKGVFLTIPRADLDWRPFQWLRNRLRIRSVIVPQATLIRTPETTPTGAQGPILPDFDIVIGKLDVQRLIVGRAVTGVVRGGRILGSADIRSGRAKIGLAAVVEGSDRLSFRMDAEPSARKFDVDVHARGIASGVLARLSGIRRPLALDVAGAGDWQAWRGKATADAGGQRIIDLDLVNASGQYTLSGAITPRGVFGPTFDRLAAGKIAVNGAGTFADSRLAGDLALRSTALDATASGAIDLTANAWRQVKFDLRLLKPGALLDGLNGRNIAARAILDGGFTAPAFDYRITADRAALDDTGLEGLRIAGKGRLAQQPWTIPLALTARRVTGVGDVGGGILRNLSVTGNLRFANQVITGNALRVRSDKLVSTVDVLVDLKTGRFEVGLNGRLGKYLIPGIGIVDVQTRLKVIPLPGGRGTALSGDARVDVLRLDNAFFRSLTGGLPRITAQLYRGPDRIFRLSNLKLTSPALTFTGSGYRRVDGTFHIEGSGRQRQYGPFRMVLDGPIEKPRVDLLLASPNAAAGLTNVRVLLEPSGDNFNFRASGGSMLGPFTGNGAILLPKGGQSAVRIDALNVGETRVAGTLNIVTGGLDGRLALTGGGLNGELLLRPVGEVQRVEAHIAAENAKLGTVGSVRRGRIDAVALLDPAGVTIEATATATALRSGPLSLARFAGNLKLRGGVGELKANIAGSRGRAFDIQSVTQIAPDRFSIAAQGTVDRRPLKLLSPAIIARDGDGWRLEQTKLSFAGGEANVAGRFGGGVTSVEGGLTRMPLAILDIAKPGLGLGGSASGQFSYTQGAGAPTGTANLTIRSLSRAGLVLSSKPIDMGLALALTSNQLGVRAVMASDGKTIGRAQARLSPLAGGDLATRLTNAPLFAQLRYNGPADTLWRLSGVEFFDLSGPVAVGADIGGRLANPTIRGQVVMNGARIESGTTGTVLTNVRGGGRFDGSRLVIDRLTATAGKGAVSASGAIGFSDGVDIDLKVDAREARVIETDTLGATITGPLTIKSDGRGGGVIAGGVTVNEGRFRLGQAAAATAVPRLNIREINVPDTGEADDTPTTPWRLDLKARAPRALAVSGLGLDSYWSADLTVKGDVANPAISGRADLIRGSYEFAGREFELERGIIRFTGSVPADPLLDIVATANVTGLSATIRVGGTGQKPEITFASTPALPQDELLSRLLFGTSITNLSAPEALQLAAAVAALNSGGSGGLNPINAVRSAIGLDRLRVVPADPQTGARTSVAAGKFITRRIYAEIVTDGAGYSATRLEFQVTRWLSLLGTISTIGRQSANVRVSKDY